MVKTRLDPLYTLGQCLLGQGFGRLSNGSYKRNGMLARTRLRWLSFQSPVKSPQVDSLSDPGHSGFWKRVPNESKETASLQFHIPLHDCILRANLTCGLSEDPEADDAEISPIREMIRWAMDTATGELPIGWQAPPQDTVQGWIPDGHLSVQLGPFLCQGSVICESERLALSFPLARELPDELTEARRGWLRAVLVDAQRRWRLVRIVLSDPPAQPAVAAVIDLSGAPHALLEDLLSISLDALRWGVQMLLWPVSFLCDPSVSCRAWDTDPADLFQKGDSHERA